MFRDRRNTGTTLIIIGGSLFLFGMLDHVIADWVLDINDNIRIFGWGWLLQIVGGLIAIYGFMIHLEFFIIMNRPPPRPGMPPPMNQFVMDPETKRLIWVLLIIALISYVLSINFQCVIMIIIILLLVFIFATKPGWRYFFPLPAYYPPSQPPVNQPPSEHIDPSKKVKLCEKCFSQLEMDWVSCPYCGQSLEKKD
jgi:hypothetical protein